MADENDPIGFNRAINNGPGREGQMRAIIERKAKSAANWIGGLFAGEKKPGSAPTPAASPSPDKED